MGRDTQGQGHLAMAGVQRALRAQKISHSMEFQLISLDAPSWRTCPKHLVIMNEVFCITVEREKKTEASTSDFDSCLYSTRSKVGLILTVRGETPALNPLSMNVSPAGLNGHVLVFQYCPLDESFPSIFSLLAETLATRCLF